MTMPDPSMNLLMQKESELHNMRVRMETLEAELNKQVNANQMAMQQLAVFEKATNIQISESEDLKAQLAQAHEQLLAEKSNNKVLNVS